MARITLLKSENDFVGGMEFHRRAKTMIQCLKEGETLEVDTGNQYLDSSMIGTLMSIQDLCSRSDIEICFLNVSEQTEKIIELSGLSSVLKIKNSGEAGTQN